MLYVQNKHINVSPTYRLTSPLPILFLYSVYQQSLVVGWVVAAGNVGVAVLDAGGEVSLGDCRPPVRAVSMTTT